MSNFPRYSWQASMEKQHEGMTRRHCNLYDRLEPTPIARCQDPLVAEKIVNALNAQEEQCSAKTQS